MTKKTLATRFLVAALAVLGTAAPLVASASSRPCSNASLRGTYVGTATGSVPASLIGGDPKATVPFMIGFVYTFDGKGHITGWGQPSVAGTPAHEPDTPLGMLKMTGTYSIEPTTCSGTEEIVVLNQGHPTTFHRWFSMSDNNTQQHFVTVDQGYFFQGTLHKR